MNRKLNLRLIRRESERQLPYKLQRLSALAGVVGGIGSLILGVVSVVLAIMVSNAETKIAKMDSLLQKQDTAIFKQDSLIGKISDLIIVTNRQTQNLQTLLLQNNDIYKNEKQQLAVATQSFRLIYEQFLLLSNSKKEEFKTTFFQLSDIFNKLDLKDYELELFLGNVASDDLAVSKAQLFIPTLEQGLSSPFLSKDSFLYEKWNHILLVSKKLNTDINIYKNPNRIPLHQIQRNQLLLSISKNKADFIRTYIQLRIYFTDFQTKL